jgi:hypothetical protein
MRHGPSAIPSFGDRAGATPMPQQAADRLRLAGA